MMDRLRGARTRAASGRLLCIVSGALLLGACQTVGAPRTAPDPSAPAVVVAPGPISESEEEEAQRLLESARSSFEARRFFEALRTSGELLDAYPASRASGEALRLTALAHDEVGQTEEALTAAERYLALVEPGDPRAAELRLLEVRASSGTPEERLERLLTLRTLPEERRAEAVETLRTVADSSDVAALERVVREAPVDGALLPVAEARLSVELLDLGREDDARLFARRALGVQLPEPEAAWAEGVLRGELPPGRERVTTFRIGAVLPITGPPALVGFAEGVREGIELAIATVLGDEFDVSAVVADDEGDPALGAEIVRQLEESDSVVAIVGFLLDDVLISGAGARSASIPVVSPTARSAEGAGEAVYSLEAPDPRAAESVAEYAAGRAFQRIAMLYPSNPAARAEADAFEARAIQLGMPVVARFEYEPGATFFEPQIRGARDALRAEELAGLALSEDDTLHMEVLEPAALFMPIPPEDVEFLAPQVVHFGLDTLAIEMLGTSGWSDAQILAEVDPRLTDGVVATAPAGAEPSDEGPRRFREAYEEAFQRSLVSSAPAVGYDATLILLEALRHGRVDPPRLRAELERLSDIHGATGIFSVEDGRVIRRTEVVRIENGEPVPMPNDPTNPGMR